VIFQITYWKKGKANKMVNNLKKNKNNLKSVFIIISLFIAFVFLFVLKLNKKKREKQFVRKKVTIVNKHRKTKPTDFIMRYVNFQKENMHIDDYTDIYCAVPTIYDKFHNSKVVSIFYERNFNKLITVSKDRSIKFWDISNLKSPKLLLTKYIYLSNDIKTADYSSGSRLLVAYENKIDLNVYDLGGNRETYIRSSNLKYVNKIAFSKDGKLLSGGSLKGKVGIWFYFFYRNRAREFTLRSHPKEVTALIFTEDRFVSGSDDGTLFFYDFDKNRSCRQHEMFRFIKKNVEKKGVKQIIYSSANYFLILTKDNSIVKYDKNGNFIGYLIRFKTNINEIAVTREGDKIVAGDEKGTLFIVDAKEGQIIKEWRILRGEIDRVKIIIKNNKPVIIASGGSRNEMVIYDFSGNLLSKVFGIGNRIYTVGIDNKDRVGFTVNPPLFGGKLQYFDYIFDLKNFKIIPADNSENFEREKKAKGFYKVERFDFKSIPIFKAFASDVLIVKKGERKYGYIIKTRFNGSKHNSYTFINGKHIASGGDDGTIIIYNLRGRVVRRLYVNSDKIYSLAVSADGKYLVSASADKKINIWKINNIVSNQDEGSIIASDQETVKVVKKYFSKEEFEQMKEYFLESKTDFPLLYNAVKNYFSSFYPVGDIDSFNLYETSFATIIPVDDKEWIIWTKYGVSTSTIYLWDKIGFIINPHKSSVWGLSQMYSFVYLPKIIKAEFSEPEMAKKLKKRRKLFSRHSIYYTLSEEIVEKNGVPSVEIVSPKNGEIFKRDEIIVRVRGKNKGGKVSDIRVFHNGRLIGSERIYPVYYDGACVYKRVYFDDNYRLKFSEINMDSLSGLVTRKYKIKLVPGENIISCDIRGNFPGYPAFETKTIKVKYDVNYDRGKKRIFVLAIGEQNFKNSRIDLRYPHNDIEKLAMIFRNYQSDEYESYEIIKLFNADKQTIINKLIELKDTMRPNDVFVLYISSHGAVKCRNLYIITANFDKEFNEDTTISSYELLEWTKLLPPVNQIFILDTCFSGAFAKEFSYIYENNPSVLLYGNGMHLMASTTNKGIALEGYNSHGLFTSYLISGLSGSADYNHDQKVSLKEVSNYIIKELGKSRRKRKYHGFAINEPVIVGCGKDIILTEIK
jgi:WD40 repeat protein